MGRWLGRTDRSDARLGRELKALRPEARPEFVEMVASRVHGRGEGSRVGRAGIAIALTGLILVAVASFGGVGYASSAASQAIKKIVNSKPAAHHAAPRKLFSSGQAQYGPFKPPTKPGKNPCPSTKRSTSSHSSTHRTACPPTKGGKGTNGGGTFKPPNSQGTKGSGLPFTGLALWIPVAIGLALFMAGLALRRLGRRREVI